MYGFFFQYIVVKKQHRNFTKEVNAQNKPKRDGEKQSHYQLSLYIMDKHTCYLVVGYTS